jgi:hypothetical protein
LQAVVAVAPVLVAVAVQVVLHTFQKFFSRLIQLNLFKWAKVVLAHRDR